MDDVVLWFRHQEALLDESQAGPLLATINQLWADKEELIRRNQTLQAAAATHSQEELTKAQAAVIAAEKHAADTEQQLHSANERIEQLMAWGYHWKISAKNSRRSLRLQRTRH